MADNTEMSDVDFEDVSVRHGECFRQHQNCQFVGETYSDNFGQRGNYRYQKVQNHNAKLDGDLCTIKVKIPAFQGKNDPEVYLK